MCSLFSFSFHKMRHQNESSHHNRYIYATLEYSDPQGKETICVVDFDLMYLGLLKLGNCFNKRGIGLIEVSKVYYSSKVESFCVTNGMKVLQINLVKIWVFSTKLIIWKKIHELRQVKLNLLGGICVRPKPG